MITCYLLGLWLIQLFRNTGNTIPPRKWPAAVSSSRPAGRIHLTGGYTWYTSYFSPRIGHFCHYAQSPCAVFPASVLITSKCRGVKFSLFKGQVILVISYHFWVWPFWIKLCLCNQRALYFALHIKIHFSAKIPQSPSLWNKALSQQNGEAF